MQIDLTPAQDTTVTRLLKMRHPTGTRWQVTRWPTDTDPAVYLARKPSPYQRVYCEVDPDGTVN